MSKAAQFEAQEKQAFVQPGAAYPQYAPQPQQAFYAPQPAYGQGGYVQQPQVHLQAYPPATSVVVINQVQQAPGGWRDPGCCTICWGVFLLIGSIVAFISGIYSLSALGAMGVSLNNCDPALDWCTPSKTSGALAFLSTITAVASGQLALSGLQLILLIAVVVFYCKRVTSPAARAWNYACWILIAVGQSFIVALFVAISAAITGGSAFLGSLLNSYIATTNSPNSGSSQAAINSALSIISIVFWIYTAIVAIPMIISSVVAHKNKAPCTCSARADYVD
jgi:hypothetical protein